jgi:hypothetical protein
MGEAEGREIGIRAMTIIAGFCCQGGIVICADTQETSGAAKRSVPKLQCFHGPVASQDSQSLVNHDLALAICGAGHGPFIDKIASQAWDAIRHVSNVWKASARIEEMIKETYADFSHIYQAGSCPEVDLIYGVTVGGASRLFQATGPIVNERSYASNGIGYYLADFLTTKMRGDGWLTIRQTVTLAAYILLQAKEHVEGCGGESHIAVLRESESSGLVNFRLIEHLEEYLKTADRFTGEMLLTAADFSIPDSEAAESMTNSLETLRFGREREIKKLKEDREFDQSITLGFGTAGEEDDLGLPVEAAPSKDHKTGES